MKWFSRAASVALASLILAPALSFARDTADGCGLGWEVTADKTMIATTTRGTTNMFVPPTFGMTTGTLGCDQLSLAANEREAMEFVATNYQPLRSELAEGQGEYVSALAQVFGCGGASSHEFGTLFQKNYDRVVVPAKNGQELYQNIQSHLRESSATFHCKNV